MNQQNSYELLIFCSGTYTELLQNEGAFAEFIRNYLNEADNEDDWENDPEGETINHISIL